MGADFDICALISCVCKGLTPEAYTEHCCPEHVNDLYESEQVDGRAIPIYRPGALVQICLRLLGPKSNTSECPYISLLSPEPHVHETEERSSESKYIANL